VLTPSQIAPGDTGSKTESMPITHFTWSGFRL